MLARMTKADAQPVQFADFIVERADMVELLRQRGWRFGYAGFKAAPDLTGQPGLALRAAADHDPVGAGHFKCGHSLLERGDIAVDDEWNSDRILDRAHRAPIGLALVELATRAAMHRDHLDAARFRTARQFRCVERAIVPAEPHLQRHRHFHGRYRRLDQSHGAIEIAHQCRAALAAGHMPRRTAHVDIYDVGAGGLGDPRAFRHPPDLAARELNDMRTYSGRLASQP